MLSIFRAAAVALLVVCVCLAQVPRGGGGGGTSIPFVISNPAGQDCSGTPGYMANYNGTLHTCVGGIVVASGGAGASGQSACVGYADDAVGTNFSRTVPKDYQATKTLPNCGTTVAADFSGLWYRVKGASGVDGANGNPACVAWADDSAGNGFSKTTPKDYQASKSLPSCASAVASDFAGLWFQIKGNAGTPGSNGAAGNPAGSCAVPLTAAFGNTTVLKADGDCSAMTSATKAYYQAGSATSGCTSTNYKTGSGPLIQIGVTPTTTAGQLVVLNLGTTPLTGCVVIEGSEPNSSADPNMVTAAGTLTSNAPMIGAGSKAAAVGSRSGNTTEFATVTGTKTAGKQLQFDASGNVSASAYDVGAAGGGGSLSMQLNSGTPVTGVTQIQLIDGTNSSMAFGALSSGVLPVTINNTSSGGASLIGAGTNGTSAYNNGDDSTGARSDHTHRIPWQVGIAFETTPSVAEFPVPLPVNNQCPSAGIDVNSVAVLVPVNSGVTFTFNVVRYNSAGVSQGNLFSGTQTYSNAGNVRQPFTPDQNATSINPTDYFRINVVSASGVNLVNFAVTVQGRCQNVQ